MADDPGDVGHRFVGLDDRPADLGVALHLGVFLVGQLAGLEEDPVRDRDLADVVQVAADPDRRLFLLGQAEHRRDPLAEHAELPAVVARLEVTGLDRRRQREGDPVEDRREQPVLERVVADPSPLQGVPDLGLELLGSERLDEHPGCPVAQRPDGVVERRVPRGDDDRDLRIAGADLGEEGVAVHARHPDIGDDEVELLGVEQGQGVGWSRERSIRRGPSARAASRQA